MLKVQKVGSGPDLLVLPGGPGLSSKYLVEGLQPLSTFCSLHFLDYPGCGNEPAGDRPVTVEVIVTAIQSTIAEYFGDQSFHVLAHSFGALVLGSLLQSAVGKQIDRILLVAPTPHDAEAAHAAQMRLLGRMTPADGETVQRIMAGQPMECGDLVRMLLPYYCGRRANIPSLPIELDPLMLAEVSSCIAPFDYWDVFNERHKVQYIFGTTDFIQPDQFRNTTQFRARYESLNGGHFIFADDPARFFLICEDFLGG